MNPRLQDATARNRRSRPAEAPWQTQHAKTQKKAALKNEGRPCCVGSLIINS